MSDGDRYKGESKGGEETLEGKELVCGVEISNRGSGKASL